MRDCYSTEQMLLVLHGELDAAGERAMSDHIDDCAVCREAFVFLQGLDGALRRIVPAGAVEACPPEDVRAAYLDGRLDGMVRDAVEAHLADCAECLEETVVLREAFVEVGAGAEPSAAFIRRPSDRLVEEVRRIPSVEAPAAAAGSRRPTLRLADSRRREPSSSGWVPFLAAAAAALFAIVAVLFSAPSGGGRSAEDDTAALRRKTRKTRLAEAPAAAAPAPTFVRNDSPGEAPAAPPAGDFVSVPSTDPLEEFTFTEAPADEESLATPVPAASADDFVRAPDAHPVPAPAAVPAPRRVSDAFVKAALPEPGVPAATAATAPIPAAATLPAPAAESFAAVTLAEVEGEIYVQLRGRREKAARGTTVPADAFVVTPDQAGGRVAVGGPSGYQIWLDRQTRIQVAAGTAGTDVKLKDGAIAAQVNPQVAPFRVTTPEAAAVVKGTVFVVSRRRVETILTVKEGLVEFVNPRGSQLVPGGSRSRAGHGRAPTEAETGVDVASAMAFTKPVTAANEAVIPGTKIEAVAGANPRLAGVVVACPHAMGEARAAAVAKGIARDLKIGHVQGWGFRNIPGRLYVNVDRPTEGSVDDKGSVGIGRKTDQAERVYREYLRHVAIAAGRPQAVLLVTIRESGSNRESVETVTSGFPRAAVERLRDLAGERLAAGRPARAVPFRFDLLDPTYLVNGQSVSFTYTEGDVKSGAGYLREAPRALTFFLPRPVAQDAAVRSDYGAVIRDLIEAAASIR